jgi:hypothetical protein
MSYIVYKENKIMNDKRKVRTDALETLGTIFTEGERDAIHLAVEPVVAGEQIRPGQNITIRDGKAYEANGYLPDEKMLGIADPFLKNTIQIGEKFWLIVYPRQITSLRHVWSHPDFNEPVQEVLSKSFSEEYLRRFASENGLEYDLVMKFAEQGWMPSDDGISVPDGFWEHYQNVVGYIVTDKHSYFRCSC